MNNIYKPLYIIALISLLTTCGKPHQGKNMLSHSIYEAKAPEDNPSLAPDHSHTISQVYTTEQKDPQAQEEKIPSYGTGLDLKEFKKMYTKEQKRINTQSIQRMKSQDSVYVLGMTRVGKSTLINKFLNNPFIRHGDPEDSDDEVSYEIQQPLVPGPAIGKKAVSVTVGTVPYFSADNMNNLCFIDSPGFQENRGPEYTLLTYITKNMIKKSVTDIKAFCFVITLDYIKDGGVGFTNVVLENLKSIFDEGNRAELMKSVFIVINRVRTKHPKRKAKFIKAIESMRDDFIADANVNPDFKIYADIIEQIIKNDNVYVANLDDPHSRSQILQAFSQAQGIPMHQIKIIGDNSSKQELALLEKNLLLEVKPIITSISQTHAAIASYQKNLETTTDGKQNIQTQLEDLSHTRDTSSEQISTLTQQLQELETQIETLSQQKAEHDQKRNDGFINNNDQGSDISIEQEAIDQAIAQKEVVKKRLERELEQEEQNMKNIQDSIDALQQKLKETKDIASNSQQQASAIAKARDAILKHCTPRGIMLQLKKHLACSDNPDWFQYHEKDMQGFETYLDYSPSAGFGYLDDIKQQLKRIYQSPIPQMTTLQGHTCSVLSVIFSPDGRTLASGSNDKTIRLWNPVNGQCINTLKGHTSYVLSVIFSPDGRTLASGSVDNTIRLWNPVKGQCINTLKGHTDYVMSVIFSPDGRTLASGSDDKTIRLWDPVNGQCINTLKGHTRYVQSVIFSPDGRTLASGSGDNTIRLWDPVKGQCINTLKGHTYSVYSVIFSPDGRTLASGSNDHTIRLWDPVNGQCINTLKGHTSAVQSVIFSPDGRTLASASNDYTVRLWDPVNGQCINTLKGHAYAVQSVSFSPDGRTLASGNHDDTLRLWSVAHTLVSSHDDEGIRLKDFEIGTRLLIPKIQGNIRNFYQHQISQLPKVDTQIEELDQQLQSLSAHRAQQQKVLDDKKAEVIAIELEIEQYNNQKVTLLQEHVESAREQAQAKANDKQHLINTITDLETQIEQRRATIEEIHTLKNELTSNLAVVNTKIETLSQQLSTLDTETIEIQSRLSILQTAAQGYYQDINIHRPMADILIEIDSIIPLGILDQDFIDQYLRYASSL